MYYKHRYQINCQIENKELDQIRPFNGLREVLQNTVYPYPGLLLGHCFPALIVLNFSNAKLFIKLCK